MNNSIGKGKGVQMYAKLVNFCFCVSL